MPTLEIDGIGEVEVDDAFTSLTPEQQAATVEEIVTSVGQGNQPPRTPDRLKGSRQGDFLPIRKNLDTGEIAFDHTAGIFGAIIDAVTLPRDVFEGKVDPLSGEAIERSFDLAATASPAPAARSAVKALTAKPKLKSIDQLRSAANAAYQQAEDAGLIISQGGFARAAESMVNAVRSGGFNRRIHPKVNAALQEVADTLGKQPTLKEMDVLRRVVKAAAQSVEPDERRLAGIMLGKLDDFVGNLAPRDVIAGDAQAGAQALTQARSLWANVRKSEAIEEIFEKAANATGANFSSAGFETALRQKFRQLADNPKRLRGFSKPEKDAIRRVARGGKIDNIARRVGKLAPTGVVSGGFGIGATAALGPVGASLPVAGLAGRAIASRLTKKNAEIARTLTRGSESPRRGEVSLKRAQRLLEKTLDRPISFTESLEATGAAVFGS